MQGHSFRWFMLSLCLSSAMLIAACATQQPAPSQPLGLLDDSLFSAPAVRVSADDVFALSDGMRRYVHEEMAPHVRALGPERALLNALYAKNQLKLDYDTTMTRNAAEAFSVRSGNCLSLVIMTAAFARELNMVVRFHNVFVDDTWERSRDLYFFIGHVNLAVGAKLSNGWNGSFGQSWTTIDFLQGQDLKGQRLEVIEEQRIVAMYMNNKAAEALARGRLDDAYAWVRGAIAQDSAFTAAYNTLGVVYQRQGALSHAERALRHALAREPGNLHAMGNLVLTLKRQERLGEAEALAAQLRRLQPAAPFVYFEQGLAALRDNNFAAASALFEREVNRRPEYHEFHFWLAIARLNLGDTASAREHLRQALANSTTREQQALYAGKLNKLSDLQGPRLQ